jgi:glycosyltransferase involved in cell wall biosynthesis
VNDNFSTLQIGKIVASDGEPKTGTESYFFDLLRELPLVGVRSSGLVLGELGSRARETPNVESFGPERGTDAATRIKNLRRAVRRHIQEADVVVAHSAEHAYTVLDIVGRKCLVVHFQGPRAFEHLAEGNSPERMVLALIAERVTYARADRFVVSSEAFAEILQRRYFVSRKRISIVPGAIDLQRFRPMLPRSDARKKVGWPQDRPIVLSVRHLAPTKGLENLVDAIVLVKKRVPAVLVVFVGGGPLPAVLEAKLDELGLQGNVRFEGILEDGLLPHAYRAADVSIAPAVDHEGFGLSVAESLACGTPALVTPVAGLPEIVGALDESLIMPGWFPEAISCSLTAALIEPGSLPSETACIDYVQRFAWRPIANQLKHAYAEALAAKSRRPVLRSPQ